MSDELRRLLAGVAALGAKTGIRFAIIGGVARGAWAPPRATLDVDVIAGSADAAAIHAALEGTGLVVVAAEAGALAASGMTRLRLPDHPRGSVRIDVILALHPYYERVLERARAVTLLGADVLVAAPEDLVLLKSLADRTQDRADVEALLDAMGDALDWDLLRAEASALEITLPPQPRPR